MVALFPSLSSDNTWPAWLRTVTLSFPSGRTAEEIVVDDAAGLAWIVNLGCVELHRIRYAATISIIRMSYVSIWIRFPALAHVPHESG
jgi:hypothetical protein